MEGAKKEMIAAGLRQQMETLQDLLTDLRENPRLSDETRARIQAAEAQLKELRNQISGDRINIPAA